MFDTDMLYENIFVFSHIPEDFGVKEYKAKRTGNLYITKCERYFHLEDVFHNHRDCLSDAMQHHQAMIADLQTELAMMENMK